jgi:hypothetical protein
LIVGTLLAFVSLGGENPRAYPFPRQQPHFFSRVGARMSAGMAGDSKSKPTNEKRAAGR